MTPKTPEPRMIKTTLRLPDTLHKAAKKRAIDENGDFQSLVIRALQQYLKTKAGRQ